MQIQFRKLTKYHLFGLCVLKVLILILYWSNQLPDTSKYKMIAKNIIYMKYTTNLERCPPTSPYLQGEFELDFKSETLEELENRLGPYLQPGGWFAPKECKPKEKVAILVPMWNRTDHLIKFLKNIHPMLMRQQIEYGMYVIEQTMNERFNKGAQLNIGFLEAMKMKDWDCFVFHDIDTVPFDDRNIYKCPYDGPRHMGVSIDRFEWRLLSETNFGQVVALTTEQYRKVNGFSNQFWSWGGEDANLYDRVKYHNYNITRPSAKIAKYKSLPHTPSIVNPKWREAVQNGGKYFNTSGLTSLLYHIKEFKKRPLFVHILVDHIYKEKDTYE